VTEGGAPGADPASPAAGARAPREPAGVRHALVAAFAAVAAAFTIGLAAAHTFDARIREAVVQITGNASPSIEYLSSMRSTLRLLEVEVADHLTACAMGRCGPPPARIAELQDEMRVVWHRYRLLPTFPGETDLWPAIDADLDRLGDGVAVALHSIAEGTAPPGASTARHELAPAFDRLDADIARIVAIDHDQGLAVARRVERLARLSTVASIAVDLLVVALTVLAALLALRLVRRYERALRERADDLEHFAARVAHDVKGPLAATGVALHAARRLAPGAAAPLDRGERGVRRVERLVDDLLEFARAGGARDGGAAADVPAVLDDVLGDLREMAAERHVEVRLEAAAAERVACSPGVLTSILENLVRNAIVHMGESAVREVRVRALPVGGVGPVRIEVEDSGPGVPDSLGDRIFEPFVRGAPAGVEGSGLGLATVKRFVSAHGGRIGYRSAAGRGTLFWLELPRPRAGVAAAPRR
jgi:signal transduction histidine kinase